MHGSPVVAVSLLVCAIALWALTIGHMDHASPDQRVLISDDGSHVFLTVEDAERRLHSKRTRPCPRCEGARQVQRGGAVERCAQCQGIGQVVVAEPCEG